MPFPPDISLSSNAKYFGMTDPIKDYNLNWDIVWSFTYALTGTEHGFCTFLTNTPTLTGCLPGHYLGYNNVNGLLGIAFDSTGYFALSTPSRTGISLSNTKKNSLIIRDSNNDVIYNEQLSSLDTNFILSSSIKVYQTLRFRYCNAGNKLYIDYKKSNIDYSNLLTINISSLNINDNTIAYPGFSFCSPISSLNIFPSSMYIQNFHTQGNDVTPTYETSEMIPLTGEISSSYTTLSGISASPYY
jgi:hypothetical protein